MRDLWPVILLSQTHDPLSRRTRRELGVWPTGGLLRGISERGNTERLVYRRSKGPRQKVRMDSFTKETRPAKQSGTGQVWVRPCVSVTLIFRLVDIFIPQLYWNLDLKVFIHFLQQQLHMPVLDDRFQGNSVFTETCMTWWFTIYGRSLQCQHIAAVNTGQEFYSLGYRVSQRKDKKS